MKIFGDVDRDRAGKIRSEYPAWYLDQNVEELRKKTSQLEKALEDEAIPHMVRAKSREKLRQQEERLTAIKRDTPKLDAKQTDDLEKMRKELIKELQDAHPKRSERDRGLIDSHEEAKRMKESCIKVTSECQAEFAKSCGIEIKDGKISRDQMDKMYKISSKILGESTDVEYLRRA